MSISPTTYFLPVSQMVNHVTLRLTPNSIHGKRLPQAYKTWLIQLHFFHNCHQLRCCSCVAAVLEGDPVSGSLFFCILRVKFSTDLSPEGRHRRLSGRRTRCRSKVIVDNFPHGLGWVQKTEKEEVKQQPESSVLLLIGVLGFWVRCTAQSSWARYLPTYPAWNIEWRALKMEKNLR